MIDDNKIKIHKEFFGEPNYKGVKYHLLINGFIVNGVEVHAIESQSLPFDRQFYRVFSEEPNSSKEVASQEINEFVVANISTLVFQNWSEIGILSVNVRLEIGLNNKNSVLIYELLPDLLLWNRQYTFVDYYLKFGEKWDLRRVGEVFDYRVGDIIEVKINTFLNKKTIVEEINQGLDQIIDIHYRTLENLDNANYTNLIVAAFEFPEQIRVFCEQYLSYFATFLKDLGINATSNLKEEAGKVLFSVTPNDDIEALDKIREALAVYLNLPASPIVYDDSFAAMRLQQQIENLQHSQRMAIRELQFNEKLLIAQSDTIHEKNITISQQQSVIEQQNKSIEKISSRSIMMDSVENKEELEEIYDGLKIGESKFLKEQLGIHLNPAKVIKTAVKNTLGMDDKKKSILGLDEEE